MNSLPLISISLASGQSLNTLVIASCSMTDTVETFSIVLKCVCIFFGSEKEKMARLFQDLKLDFDIEKEIEDYTPLRFNLLLRKNCWTILKWTFYDKH